MVSIVLGPGELSIIQFQFYFYTSRKEPLDFFHIFQRSLTFLLFSQLFIKYVTGSIQIQFFDITCLMKKAFLIARHLDRFLRERSHIGYLTTTEDLSTLLSNGPKGIYTKRKFKMQCTIGNQQNQPSNQIIQALKMCEFQRRLFLPIFVI